MGQTKHYLNNLICLCAETPFGQDAIEHAILNGLVTLTGHKAADEQAVMSRYDDICAHYRAALELKAA